MNISDFFDCSVISNEYFTRETMESELIKVPFSYLKCVELKGNIGEGNYFYIKEDDLCFFQTRKKFQ